MFCFLSAFIFYLYNLRSIIYYHSNTRFAAFLKPNKEKKKEKGIIPIMLTQPSPHPPGAVFYFCDI